MHYLPLSFTLNVKSPFDNRRPLQPSDGERVRLRPVSRHDLASLDGEIIQRIIVVVLLRLVLEADEASVVEEDEVAGAPGLDVLPSLEEPALFDDLRILADGGAACGYRVCHDLRTQHIYQTFLRGGRTCDPSAAITVCGWSFIKTHALCQNMSRDGIDCIETISVTKVNTISNNLYKITSLHKVDLH